MGNFAFSGKFGTPLWRTLELFMREVKREKFPVVEPLKAFLYKIKLLS
jgi:hypothetical protein